MTKKFLTATALVCALIAPSVASAATFEAKPLECEGKSGCFILGIAGEIVPGDEKKFEDLVKKNGVKMAVVWLNSPGGNVLAGYTIGKSIVDKGYTTIVTSKSVCMSMCASIWLAGSTHQVEAGARIGFHGAYTADKKGNVTGGCSGCNALVGSYYAHLGLSDMAILYMTTAGPKEMRWLNPADAKKYDIAVEEHAPKTTVVVGPWPKEPEAAANSAPVAPGALSTIDNPNPSPAPVTTSSTSPRSCVAVVEAPAEVRADPEFSASNWLTLHEAPTLFSKVVGKTGTVGTLEADATSGEWTHLVNRGWVKTKYVTDCTRNANVG